MKSEELRKKYPEFIFERFDFSQEADDLVLSFLFKTPPDLEFVHTAWIRNVSPKISERLDSKVLRNLVFSVGLSEILGYWKATCSPKITIKAGFLDAKQINWWHDLFMKGMGQFYYENNIDFTKNGFLSFNVKSNFRSLPKAEISSGKIMVPIGGGKDSAVTLETLSERYRDLIGFVIYQTPASLEVARRAGLRKVIRIDRSMHPKLLQLNSKGYLNGHTPYSAVLAFYSVLCAYIFGYKYIPFSNERSSEEGNVKFLGKEINHQYSKTLEFENKFKWYNKKFLSDSEYFSFLRPIYDIQIAKLFSRMDRYFDVVRSCNVGFKTNTWCCQCAKCLSSFILLYPFLGPKRILKIFPKDLYEDKNLLFLLENLILKDRIKPFECVGTREELKIGLYLSMKLNKKQSLLLKMVWDNYLSKEKSLDKKAAQIFSSWSKASNLSGEYASVLRKAALHE